MTTSDKNNRSEPQSGRKKGGADGDAKSAVPKTQPSKKRGGTPSKGQPKPNVKSRKITSSRA
jgi:hypothetical protein